MCWSLDLKLTYGLPPYALPMPYAFPRTQVCMGLLEMHGGDIDRVLRALQHEDDDDEHDGLTDLVQDGSLGVPQHDQTLGGDAATVGGSNWV